MNFMKIESAYVYILECEDGSLYTGITKDLDNRLSAHFNKKKEAAKYTKSHPVKEVKAVFEATSYKSAARLEYAIKKLTRAKKLSLIEDAIKGRDLMSYFPKLADEKYVYIDRK